MCFLRYRQSGLHLGEKVMQRPNAVLHLKTLRSLKPVWEWLQLNQVIRPDWTVLLTSRCVVGRGCSLDKRQENNENAKERPLWKILIGLSTLDNIFFYKLFIHVITLWTICSMDWTFHSQLTTDVWPFHTVHSRLIGLMIQDWLFS